MTSSTAFSPTGNAPKVRHLHTSNVAAVQRLIPRCQVLQQQVDTQQQAGTGTGTKHKQANSAALDAVGVATITADEGAMCWLLVLRLLPPKYIGCQDEHTHLF